MSCWDGIDEFVAVATAGSFIGGARALGVSTSHISRAIQDMEQRLETQLFHRTTRVVRLSDTGRSLLDHCRQLIADREDMLALIHEESEPQGELRLTCSTAMGERFLAPIMRRFAMRNPRLSVTLDLTNRVVDLIVEGYIECYYACHYWTDCCEGCEPGPDPCPPCTVGCADGTCQASTKPEH